MNNKRLGNSFEQEFCEILFLHGFWVHNLAQNQAGQPADVIAVKNGIPYLIDCKVCTSGTFNKNRIEENQHLSMQLWDDSGNNAGLFAVKFGENIYMAQICVFDYTNKVNLPEKFFRKYAKPLDKWLEEEGR